MKKLFFLWLFFLIVYLLVAGKGKFQWHTTTRNYFSLQAYSWLNGHLDLVIAPKDLYDLSVYNNKIYLYWQPFPTILILPFVLLFGVGVSDVFYTAFYASFGPVLMYLVLQQAKKAHVIPNISQKILYLLVLFFAFGTVYFYLSITGTVYYTSQIISILPLLLSFYLLFKFAENKKDYCFILSILALGISFWSRNFLLLSLPVYLYILFISKNPNKIKLVSYTIGFILINLIIFGFYNYIRFGNPLENGLRFQKFHPRYTNDIKRFGVSNIHFIPYNAFYLFINSIGFKQDYPFINSDPEGNSIFSISPLFSLFFGLLTIRIFNRRYKAFFILLVTSCLIIITFLSYYASGNIQFGYRYSLDAIPLLILSLTYVIEMFPLSFTLFLFVLSVIINSLGVLWVQSIAPYLGW